ncbi:MAG: hypothetical protein KDH15_16445 [Rhodocyclaceae bacterium]|nr:hypothetical protein [Rhodocyclaceae bacterium]
MSDANMSRVKQRLNSVDTPLLARRNEVLGRVFRERSKAMLIDLDKLLAEPACVVVPSRIGLDIMN